MLLAPSTPSGILEALHEAFEAHVEHPDYDGYRHALFLDTRAFTWYANDLQGSPYLALIHLPIIPISLGIGSYLFYLGVKGRRATRQAG